MIVQRGLGLVEGGAVAALLHGYIKRRYDIEFSQLG